MKVTLVVNPFSSSVTPRRRALLEDALRADHELQVLATEARDHATELAAAAARSGAEAVVVLGGDGTMNEAANGLVGTATPLAPMPGGSTNVFARTLGVSNRLSAAIVQLREALAVGSVHRIPVGMVNGRRFLFHTGLGFDAAVVAQVERRPQLKRCLGQVAFAVATVTTLARHFDRSRTHFTMRFDPETAVVGAYAVVMCSNPYTYLGPIPLDLTLDALPGRGLVAVTVRKVTVASVGGLLLSAIGTGKRLRASRRVDHRPDLHSLIVEGNGPFPYQVDGDYLGLAESLQISYESHALAVVSAPPRGGKPTI